MKTTKKPTSKTKKPTAKKKLGFDHHCDWREAALKLAKCVVFTLQTDGKLGIGSGMVLKERDGKRVVERWDKDFHEALAFIGIEVVDKPAGPKDKPKRKRSRVTDAAEEAASP